MSTAAIVDYGVGTLFSLTGALRRLGAPTVVTSDADAIRAADAIILPGVGAFGDAAARLRASGLADVLDERIGAGVPLMGICLGMQLLFERSFEYGEHAGLGYLPGSVVPLSEAFARDGIDLKVPHMGWNALDRVRDDVLIADVPEGACVYFVHSYVADARPEHLVATAGYGIDVPAIVRAGNVCGCQFHPEKSGDIGLSILAAFLDDAKGGRI